MPFFDRLRTSFSLHLLSVSVAAQDRARAQRVDPGSKPYGIGLASPNAFPGNLQNFYQQMLELRGRPPGLIRGVLAPRGTHRSMVMYGQHEDDEEKDREKRNFVERWLATMMSFDQYSAALADEIVHNRDAIDEHLDKINADLERLQATEKQKDLEKIARLKARKEKLKQTKEDLAIADRERREARTISDLQAAHTSVQNVAQQVNTHTSTQPSQKARSWKSFFRKKSKRTNTGDTTTNTEHSEHTEQSGNSQDVSSSSSDNSPPYPSSSSTNDAGDRPRRRPPGSTLR